MTLASIKYTQRLGRRFDGRAPEIGVRNYRAVLRDTRSRVLVVVPQGSFNDRLPKITLRPNVATKFGVARSVVSLGSAKLTNFADRRYLLLVGKVAH